MNADKKTNKTKMITEHEPESPGNNFKPVSSDTTGQRSASSHRQCFFVEEGETKQRCTHDPVPRRMNINTTVASSMLTALTLFATQHWKEILTMLSEKAIDEVYCHNRFTTKVLKFRCAERHSIKARIMATAVISIVLLLCIFMASHAHTHTALSTPSTL